MTSFTFINWIICAPEVRVVDATTRSLSLRAFANSRLVQRDRREPAFRFLRERIEAQSTNAEEQHQT